MAESIIYEDGTAFKNVNNLNNRISEIDQLSCCHFRNHDFFLQSYHENESKVTFSIRHFKHDFMRFLSKTDHVPLNHLDRVCYRSKM